MALLTRRERLGLLALLIICALILGGLALKKPRALPAAELSKISETSDSSDTSDDNSDSIPLKPAKKPKKQKQEKKKTPPDPPRNHLREPF